jgi:hypothetical protein
MPRHETPTQNQRAAALDDRANDLARTVEAQARGPQKTTAKAPASHRLSSSDISPEDSENFHAFMKELGTADSDFAEGLFAQLLNVSARGADKFHGRALFFSLAVIRSSKPKDELEAMHIAQMAAVHEATMRVAGEVARAENQLQREARIRAMNQLARTYCAQLDALKRYRAKAENISMQNAAIAQAGGSAVSEAGRSLKSEADSGIAQAILGRPCPTS